MGSVYNITIDGCFIISQLPSKSGISLKRTFVSTVDQRLFLEKWELKNESDTVATINIGNTSIEQVTYGNDGQYIHGVKSESKEKFLVEIREGTRQGH